MCRSTGKSPGRALPFRAPPLFRRIDRIKGRMRTHRELCDKLGSPYTSL